jgi:hypothetical protein
MSDERKMINWTRPMLERFKKEYQKAVAAKKDTFVFDGNEFVVSYAKYLIEYLESKL